MAQERFFSGSEAVRDRTKAIVLAQTKISEDIWTGVTHLQRFAYDRLDADAYRGKDITDESFVQREDSMIRTAFPAIRARLQQEYVDRAMSAMIELNRNAPDQPHVVELFPPGNPDEKTDVKPSALDILKVIPDTFEEEVIPTVEKARQHVANAVVARDPLARIGLARADWYSVIIVGQGTVLSVPTVIPSVSLRYRKTQQIPQPVVEFVMDPIAV